jgi:predicted transcriptional regulator
MVYLLNMTKRGKPKMMILRTEEQRRAVASPLRMELIGLFLERKPLSVAQMAERMGRSATALYYHVGVLEKAGLLKRAGKQRSGRRSEALYLPVADMFKMEQESDNAEAAATALKTMATAFRMAEGDMRAALTDPRSKSAGPYRNVYGTRIHCRISKKNLAELNRHLRAIEKMVTRAHKSHEPSPDDQFVSLTLALMPLRNREVRP